MNNRLVLTLIAVLALTGWAVAARGQTLETRGSHCNDTYFNSDGSGISGCMDFALHYGNHIVGAGLFGVSPEQFGNVTSDPLEELARATVWYGQEFETGGIDYALMGHIGLEGGMADELALEAQNAVHRVAGIASKGLNSSHDTQLIGGASGWVRRNFTISEAGSWGTVMTPYAHGAFGNDTIEAGAGIMLAVQPTSETRGLALVMPRTGAYAPAFGGDGIGIFAGFRGVALETLYDDMSEPFIAEAGVTGQATLWEFLVVGASASCTSLPYDGAEKPDCKATIQMGGLF